MKGREMPNVAEQLDLENLASRLADEREEAFQEFAENFGPRLVWHFRKNGLLQHEAEDLAATCVTDIALKIKRYQPSRGSFGAWAFAIARNALADRYKQAKRTSEVIKNWKEETEREAWTSDDEPGLDIEVVLQVQSALAELSEIDRVLIQRRTLQHPYKDLALELGITEDAARVRHLRALRRVESVLLRSPQIQKRIERNRSRSSRP